MTLDFKTGCVFSQCVLQVLYLRLKRLDVLQVLVLLLDFSAQLVEHLTLLFLYNIGVLLVEKDSILLGCEIGKWCLSRLFASHHDWSLRNFCRADVLSGILVRGLLFLEEADLVLLVMKLAFQLLCLLAHRDDFGV